MEKFERKNIITEKGEMIFGDFDVVYFDRVKENLGEKIEDKFEEVKDFVDEILGSKWELNGKKLKVYLFCDEKQYKDYLEKHFPGLPGGWATFDNKTSSIFKCASVPKEEIDKNICQSNILAGVGHEMAHMHPFFGGVGNKASKGKWEQEMVCVFIEDKIRIKMGNERLEDINLKIAQKELEKFKKEGKGFFWEEVDDDWENFYRAERFVYPWLEQKYGIDKLRNLWQQLFKEKKPLSEAIENIYCKKIGELENNFGKDMENTWKPCFQVG